MNNKNTDQGKKQNNKEAEKKWNHYDIALREYTK